MSETLIELIALTTWCELATLAAVLAVVAVLFV